MTDIFTRRSMFACHTKVAGRAGSTQSAIIFSTAAMYVVTVAKVVALQAPSVGGWGLYRVHSYCIGWQLHMSKKKYRMLNTVTEPRIVQMTICRQRFWGQIRSKNSPTIHFVSRETRMYVSDASHLYMMAVGRRSGNSSLVCFPRPYETARIPNTEYAVNMSCFHC